ncbi:phosphate ABC transporter permease subunit PstC [Massilia sp. Dwa41.01b]|uniref:phosphate ABC transporter permease subunit PstC n=1 Tax=unclassified Massilia TaxID=2609279 RepID=UPI0016006B34|nr:MULTISPECIES: phosphate ABC transporter permease subunit PstC [unclassified Massilia]QNA90906.1 phosphate ABC transporter permease subunit PstC [Massilia sp. Dwa41.01b]QNA98171.1 phosphate ABC transporter permease subunit PstC [Massilia sp. Se16.2.3]
MKALVPGHALLRGAPSQPAEGSGRRVDSVLLAVVCCCALVASLLIVLIGVFLVKESYPLVQKIGFARFLFDEGWWPGSGQYNLVPMIGASLLLTLSATLIAAPLAIVFAVCLAFYCGERLRRALRLLVDLSASVPTIIYAFWGLVTIVPLVAAIDGPGTSVLAGSLVLALMIFPTIAILCHSAIAAVPSHYFVAGAALGVRRSALIRHVVLPHARSGIVAAVILGAARAIGETMVVLVLCGNIVQMPSSVFDPVRTLTANIALEMPYAQDDHRAALYVSGLIVLLVVTTLVLMSELYAHRKHR